MDGWWAASYLALWALAIVLAVVVVALARQVGALNARLGPRAVGIDDGPPLGATPAPVQVLDLAGAKVTVGGPGQRQLLLFLAPGCTACELFLPALPAIARSGQVTPRVITAADATEAEQGFATYGVAGLISSPQLLETYNVPSTPYAVVLDRSGAIRAKGTIGSIEQIERLVEAAGPRSEVATSSQRG